MDSGPHTGSRARVQQQQPASQPDEVLPVSLARLTAGGGGARAAAAAAAGWEDHTAITTPHQQGDIRKSRTTTAWDFAITAGPAVQAWALDSVTAEQQQQQQQQQQQYHDYGGQRTQQQQSKPGDNRQD